MPHQPPGQDSSSPAIDIAAAFTSSFLESPAGQTETALCVHLGFLASLQAAVPSITTASLGEKCVDLYTRYVFGAFPLCHEISIREAVNRFFIPLPDGPGSCEENRARVALCFTADNEVDRIGALRSVTLLTALCAAVSYVVPETLLPEKYSVAPLFLRAARRILRIYEDYDLEHPDSSSLGIRTLFSTAIQSATGMLGASTHNLNQAGVLAMKMRLYDEKSFQGLDPIEETLLRNMFWQLYVCDQTVLVMGALGSRPVTIHEALFETDFTVKARSSQTVPLLIHDGCPDGAKLEESLAEGFHIICRLWTMAARVVHGMKVLSRKQRSYDGLLDPLEGHADAIARLSAAYFEVITLKIEFPSASFTTTAGAQAESVRSHGSSSSRGEQYLVDMLHRQHTSYLLSLHSIKAMVLSSATQCGMTEVLGLSAADPSTLAMRQIELAQDFSHILESVPFTHLQTEGEHCVSQSPNPRKAFSHWTSYADRTCASPKSEKIRWIGSLLLEITHDASNEIVRTRANQCAMRLVEMLARLDSKASDNLGQQMMMYQL